ncbi:MAG: hypothetical protein ABI218_03225 [Caldimonas sp.]
MLIQSFLVAVIVATCVTYAVWTLMPAFLRRPLARAMLRLPLPRGLSAAIAKYTVEASGCACDGCDKGQSRAASTAPSPSTGAGAPLVFHPRPRK